MKNFRCLILLTFVLTAATTHAESLDLTIFGAAQHQGKLTLQSASTVVTTTSSFNPGTFGTFGLRFGHGKVFGGEHTFAYAPNFLTSDSKAIIYNSNVMIQAPIPKIQPYGTAGLGAIFSWGTDDAGRPALGKIGEKFAINYGGGVKIFPAGPVGVRFDIRGYAIPSVKFNIPVPTLTNPTATIQSTSQTLNMFEAGIGVVFKF
jgi:opacity protein-like surface antigen